MDKETIYVALIGFAIMVCFFYYHNLFKLNNKNKKKKKHSDIMEIRYLSITANINKELLMHRRFLLLFGIINAFIVDIVFVIVMVIKVPIFIKFVLGLFLFLGLIYSIYGILGKILVMKGFENDEHKRN